ncbi:MAG: acetylxylan esterase [Planctomycetia bacterium]|nr:acetylxylan esterase [Planctomycetia bacterium]
MQHSHGSRLRSVLLLGITCTAAAWLGASSTWAAPPEAPATAPAAKASPASEIPWDMAALNRAPQVTWLDQTGPTRRLTYQGPPFHGKPTRVFAYYASPATLLSAKDAPAKKYPGIVLVHGGGGTAFKEWAQLWARRGYAAIAMDLAGCGEKGKRLPDGGPDQSDNTKFGQISAPPTDQWTYHAVADVVLAHSLLRSLPDVDADRTAVTGISWGGYLTCIVAGVDPRFKAAVPVYGCGFLHENSYWKPILKRMPAADRDNWVRLWDPSRYGGGAKLPMLFVNGTNDFAYFLDSYAKTYGLTQGPRNYRITVRMPHGHQQGWAPAEIGLFVDQYLKEGTPLPVIARPQLEQQKVHAAVTSSTEIKSAALHYTLDGEPNPQRKWTDQPLKIEGKEVHGPAPPPAATIWFLTVTDTRGATVSSELMFGKQDKTK